MKSVSSPRASFRKLDPSWLPATPQVDADGLPDLFSIAPVVVLHFWAAWNGYDRDLDRHLQVLAPLLEGRLVVRAVNIDRECNWPLARACRLVNIPALVCFVSREHHEALVGLREFRETQAKLLEWAEVGRASAQPAAASAGPASSC